MYENVEKARAVLDQFTQQRTPIFRNTMHHLLQGCIECKELSRGRCLYSHAIVTGLDSVPVLTDLIIHLFSVCARLRDAEKVFVKVLKPSAYTWNIIISAYANCGEPQEALVLYELMRRKGAMPDRVTFLSVVKAICSFGSLRHLRLVHDHAQRAALDLDVILGSSLVDAYAKCGSVEEAQRLFDRMPSRNIVSWGAMMDGYIQHNHSLLALELFQRMQLEAVAPNRAVYIFMLKACASMSALQSGRLVHDLIIRQKDCESEPEIGNMLLDMYCKCRSLDEAGDFFEKLPSRSIVAWGAIISGYASCGYLRRALYLLEAMQQEGLKPDCTIFTSILTACSHASLLEEGYHYFKLMKDEFGLAQKIEHYACMIGLLGRVGHLGDAAMFVQSMPIEPDSILLTSLLTGSRTHHNADVAMFGFERFVQM